ncbi:YHS domain-containing protein [Clostridium sp. DJ247]|uniref:YHS domain-containing protein n=1 Tax=Clostridium sp. DJ247 TaxID=2726188 RepID=UPI00162AA7D3|nr:YHS domain-containing protein [Clostridium sp. DJ247]MBC2582053.1 YHS domain-containing protein [Clostridium sp. DJ247]
MLKFLAENWWYILFFGLMAYMMFRGGGCCGGGHSSHSGHDDSHGGNYRGGCCGGGYTYHMNHKDHEEHSAGYIENTTNMSIDTAQDPVCGMNVSKIDAISREINGKTYYFCSQNCANKFERKHAVS